jgi:hypothetical protein
MYYRPQTRSVPVLKHQEPEANDYFKTVLLLPEHTAVILSPPVVKPPIVNPVASSLNSAVLFVSCRRRCRGEKSQYLDIIQLQQANQPEASGGEWHYPCFICAVAKKDAIALRQCYAAQT